MLTVLASVYFTSGSFIYPVDIYSPRLIHPELYSQVSPPTGTHSFVNSDGIGDQNVILSNFGAYDPFAQVSQYLLISPYSTMTYPSGQDVHTVSRFSSSASN